MSNCRYEVVASSQVLKSGSWGEMDCYWVWEDECKVFCGYDIATDYFESIPLSNDTPIARLYRFELDEYNCRINEELLDERNY